MTIAQRYLIRQLVRVTGVALLALLGLFTFLSLIDQLEDAGAAGYGIAHAIGYVGLTMPRLVYEILPVAATIGGMATLALLSRRHELDVLRLAGVSDYALAAMLGKSALALALFSVLVGEVIVPVTEKQARYQRSMAQEKHIAARAAPGFWAREGDSFINVRKMLPGGSAGGIRIYEFDGQARLRNSITAASGRYDNGRWLLEDVQKTMISAGGVERRHYRQAAWQSSLNPGLIDLALIDPHHLPAQKIHSGIRFLRANSQSAAPYEQALYGKLVRPFTIIALVMLAAPLVLVARGAAPGRHVFHGALAGVTFYYCDSASGHIGAVYGISPLLSAVTPTLLLYALVAVLLRRNNAGGALARISRQTAGRCQKNV